MRAVVDVGTKLSSSINRFDETCDLDSSGEHVDVRVVGVVAGAVGYTVDTVGD